MLLLNVLNLQASLGEDSSKEGHMKGLPDMRRETGDAPLPFPPEKPVTAPPRQQGSDKNIKTETSNLYRNSKSVVEAWVDTMEL
ncbi:MAG: hypothetical protein H6925_04445 [Holosporaceae bacterium]|nr:MAG: hypothetical protein H6925_04445 [Holosporaceae bacterium]